MARPTPKPFAIDEGSVVVDNPSPPFWGFYLKVPVATVSCRNIENRINHEPERDNRNSEDGRGAGQ